MSRPRDPKNWRELRGGLDDLGAVPIRANGSHETWRFGDGETFIVIINHLSDAVPIGILVRFRRLRRRRCARAGEEPALLGLAGSW
jgi:predicted RNA binding protein YcfA (HicA-like mRNA interferase family)